MDYDFRPKQRPSLKIVDHIFWKRALHKLPLNLLNDS